MTNPLFLSCHVWDITSCLSILWRLARVHFWWNNVSVYVVVDSLKNYRNQFTNRFICKYQLLGMYWPNGHSFDNPIYILQFSNVGWLLSGNFCLFRVISTGYEIDFFYLSCKEYYDWWFVQPNTTTHSNCKTILAN